MKKATSYESVEEALYTADLALCPREFPIRTESIVLPRQPPKPKNLKYRVTSAFRSFRTPSKSMSSNGDSDSEKSVKRISQNSDSLIERGKKASSLIKRFSFRTTTRQSVQRTKSDDFKLLKSTDSTADNLKRHTPEGGNLSVSEVSLPTIDTTSETDLTISENVVNKTGSLISLKPRKSQLEIKITGKKNEKYTYDKPIIKISSEKLDTDKFEPRKPDRKSLNITHSNTDQLPSTQAPEVPYSISDKDIENILEQRTPLPTQKTTNEKSKGAIRKQPIIKTVTKPVDSKIKMNKTGSLERGRRFPRPQTHDKKSDDENLKSKDNKTDVEKISNPPKVPELLSSEIEQPIIKFEVGKPVRPIIPSNLDYTIRNVLTSSDSLLIRNVKFSRSEFQDNNTRPSTFESNDIQQGLLSNRRRIAYVEQISDDDIDLPDVLNTSNLTSKSTRYETSMVKKRLRSIDQYSLDSEGSIPYFGQLFETHDDDYDSTIMATTSPEKREHLYKILVIGELGTGKTSFIKRYVHQFFSQNYRATIGVDFALKVLNWDQNTIIRLQLWDIAGQERFGNMTRVYYKEAVGAFIVFDVTRSATFDAVIKWKQDLDSKVQLQNGSPIPCILLANKCDQQKHGLITSPTKMDEYVKEYGFAAWFETSAKDNVNIEDAANSLVNKILLNDKLINAADIIDAEKFGLDGRNGNGKKKNCSC